MSKSSDHKLRFVGGLHLSTCRARGCSENWQYEAVHREPGRNREHIVRRFLCAKHAEAWAKKHGLPFPPANQPSSTT
jgi:hypothetical protein